MSEYSQGVCQDGTAILKNGDIMTIEEIIKELRNGSELEKKVILPTRLTAGNGAKCLLSGEFFENIELMNPNFCDCGQCNICLEFPDESEMVTIKVPVSWTTIKNIYETIVRHYA